MNRRFSYLLCLFASLGGGGFLDIGQAHADIYDLKGDWSETNNPNGPWRYRQGSSNLPGGTWSDDFASQNAWVGVFPATLFQAQSVPGGFDVAVSDIVLHSSESDADANALNVTWTSPATSLYDIDGGVWMLREIGRGNSWELFLNGSSLSSGTISSGDAYSRTSPFDLDTGTGGALDAVPMNTGDIVELRCKRAGPSGDYTGVNLSFTSVPEPSSGAIAVGFAVFCSGWALLATRSRRRVRARNL